MGYWGYFVVGRAERPLAELDALSGAADMTLRRSAPDGWQVWEFPGGDGDVGNMNDLAGQTGAPALFGYVMDSDCVVVEAAAPESGAWTTCLARSAMAGYLGAEKEGLTLEDYFLEPRDAAERAVAWAAEAGHTASAGELTEVLSADPGSGSGPGSATGADSDPVAEKLFFRFLDRLGVVPL
ncbi:MULTISPECIES: hypothetical protein [Streptomyces]|uniref:Uncharacterized protein n=1 Tax=Streptomyces rochei TaxID=1928 RepID=A0AAX3ZLU3_STRRO|nr:MULTISPECIES: hypothetical protein [Streptomyces]GGY71735.1 hypothetical protein GCM10010385_22040 [Streptomyces geysiriensis]PVD12162.1 hypothetical protein DBP22_01665 [Streptomyces sp. CS207]RSS06043.1 hypothetical protein EF913_02580 [Streptomyces sp. WAC04189]RSS77593.1 hypothetical protein EF911_03715 [Streptomyces sp. WAC06128]RSS91932.1 hypothetical protein EF919_20250 [Streptomyces sp. WAC02707]